MIRLADGGGDRATVRADVHDAVECAVAEMTARGGVVLVTGSLQTAATILSVFREGRSWVGSARVTGAQPP